MIMLLQQLMLTEFVARAIVTLCAITFAAVVVTAHTVADIVVDWSATA